MNPPPEFSAAQPGCWHTIGVLGGDRSCGELEHFIHCRNCPVHAEAGARSLERALPDGYREEWTQRFAAAKISAAAKTSALVFRVGAEWFALPTVALQFITEQRIIRSLPNRRHAAVLGLANVRGELLVCLSPAKLLGLDADSARQNPAAGAARFLVTGWQGSRQVFPVDEVFGVTRFAPEEIRSAPAGFARGLIEAGGHVTSLLDADKFFAAVNGSFA